MHRKTKYRINLFIVPLLIVGSVWVGVTLSSMQPQAENLRFHGLNNFLIIAIFPPLVLGAYYIYMIREHKKEMKKVK